jgi:hypothetical protein
MHSKESGAEIQARSPKSSIDLATLVDLIAKALSPNNLAEMLTRKTPNTRSIDFPARRQPPETLYFSRSSPVIFTAGIQKAFNPTKGDGFIQNLPMPAYGTRSRIGGCLTEGNAAKLPAALDRLIAAIDQAIDTALPQEASLSSLLLEQTHSANQSTGTSSGYCFQKSSQHS